MIMLFSASITVFCCGLLCLKDSDLAWQLYEWDCRQIGLYPRRMKQWRLRVQQVGYGLLGLGVLGFAVAVLGLL